MQKHHQFGLEETKAVIDEKRALGPQNSHGGRRLGGSAANTYYLSLKGVVTPERRALKVLLTAVKSSLA